MKARFHLRFRTTCKAYTLIELLAFMFVVYSTSLAGLIIGRRYGKGPGIAAGFLAFVVSAGVVVLFYWWMSRREQHCLRELREKYRGIYRVTALPSSAAKVVMPPGAEIKIGDYGWETGPLHKDGLIYLQGLTREWTVVWHAGFDAAQVEKVAVKPSSQYDLWMPYWARRPAQPACPFPVLERKTLTLGLPHYSHSYLTKPIPYPARPSQTGSPT